MKRIGFAIGLVILVFAGALQAQTVAPKPGPEQMKLNVWVGDWTYEGENYATPLGPAGKYVGKQMVRPILGGFFVEFRGEDGIGSWYEVDGYDAVNKKFFWNGFSSDGSVNAVTYTIDGTTVEYSGTVRLGEKQDRIRGTCVFAADFMSFVDKRELSTDGQTWMPNFQSKSIKTKKSN
jgi:hypothetical protein